MRPPTLVSSPISSTRNTASSRRPARHAAKFLVTTVCLMALSYLAAYFPYESSSLPGRMISGYLQFVAQASGAFIRLFDSSVSVSNVDILGRFSLRIVRSCSSLEAQGLLAAAVIAFPAKWQYRALGVLAGVLLLNLTNFGRIALLYWVGIRFPAAFDVLHEEVLQLVLILVAGGAFVAWAVWVRDRGTPNGLEASHVGVGARA